MSRNNSSIVKSCQKVRNRLLFEVKEAPILRDLLEQKYYHIIKQYTHLKSIQSLEDKARVQQLHQDGIAMTSLEDIASPFNSRLLDDSSLIIPELLTVFPQDSSTYLIKAPSDQLMLFPYIFWWGLQEKILRIAEAYFELPVAYHGVYFRRDLANQVKRKTRLWHLDKEDRRMLKIIIYLNDVTPEKGPFQYIPKNLTHSIFQKLQYNYGYVSEQRMQSVIPQAEWKSCCGPAGTVIFVDPASIFHRGKKPFTLDRLTLFFDYTSRIPKHPYYCKSSFSTEQLSILCDSLTEYQKDCVFWKRPSRTKRLA
ncbi:MAG: 2OG-Fe(II) oxygenase [Cyanobacteria bacterium J06592_8]